MDIWTFRAFVVSVAAEDVFLRLGKYIDYMKDHMLTCWDNGAWKTLWSYYNDRPTEDLHRFLHIYFGRYYKPLRGGRVVINPSAATVALCRELS